jgi:hypothetical protein
LQPVTNSSCLRQLLCIQMFETNLLVQVSSYPQENIPLSSEYNIIHPYAKQYVLRMRPNTVVTNYDLTKIIPHMFFLKAKYQYCFQVSTTQCIVVNFKACVLFVVQNIWMTTKCIRCCHLLRLHSLKIPLPVVLLKLLYFTKSLLNEN